VVGNDRRQHAVVACLKKVVVVACYSLGWLLAAGCRCSLAVAVAWRRSCSAVATPPRPSDDVDDVIQFDSIWRD